MGSSGFGPTEQVRSTPGSKPDSADIGALPLPLEARGLSIEDSMRIQDAIKAQRKFTRESIKISVDSGFRKAHANARVHACKHLDTLVFAV